MFDHIHELLTDQHTDKVSMSKTNAGIAALVAAFCLIWETVHGNLTEWLFWAYIAVYSGSPVVNNLIAYRYGGKPETEKETVDGTRGGLQPSKEQ